METEHKDTSKNTRSLCGETLTGSQGNIRGERDWILY